MSGAPELPCEPDEQAMIEFVQLVFAHSGQAGLVEIGCSALKPPHSLSQGRQFDLADLDEAVEYACRMNAQPNCNVYISAGLRRPGTHIHARAKDADVGLVVALWIDCDEPGSLAAATERAAEIGLTPNIVTFTGHHPHTRGQMWWVLDEPSADLKLHRRLMEVLARVFRSDPSVVNPSRLMRLPGSVAYPRKDGRVLEMTGIMRDAATRDDPYTLEEIEMKLRQSGAEEQTSKPSIAFDFNGARPKLEINELIEKARKPGHWHESALSATASMLARGTPPAHVLDVLTPALQQPGYTYSQTRRELQVMVEGAVKRGIYQKQLREGGTDPLDRRPTLHVVQGRLHQTLDEAENHLLAANVGLYQRGGQVVRVATAPVSVSAGKDATLPQIIAVTPAALADTMTRCIRFKKYNGKAKGWVDINCPKNVADTYLSRVGNWKLPILAGLISSPTLRPDGSILQTEGYDPATGLLFDARGIVFPTVPENPNREDALAALALIKTLVKTFPFADEASRSAALAAMLTSLIRRSLSTAPLFAFTAPAAGSGKSMLVDIVSMIVTGVPVPVISQGKGQDEMEKRLGAALIAGFEFVSIDNCEAPLEGELLCQMLTQTSVRVRILGLSKFAEAPTNTMVFATGNNLVLAGDLTRRAIRVTLDPQVERPELRAFTKNPLEDASRNRADYVVALLTILRAWEVAGKPTQVRPLGSFEDWSSRVRGALLWLEEADPCATIEDMREDDPKLDDLKSLIGNWLREFSYRPVTARELIERDAGSLKDILLLVAGDRGAVESRKLGQWLRANRSRIVDGHKIVRDGERSGVALWRIVNVEA